MKPSADTIRHDIVLVGGGHAHVQVMTAFGMDPPPGARLTLVTDRLLTPYSGMLPGHIAGEYSHADVHIDLWRLARATGTRLIHAPANGIDLAEKRIAFADRPALSYDTLSIDVGITPDVSAIDGAVEHALLVKPIADFLDKLETGLRATPRPKRFAVVGGGAAGFELACALKVRLVRDGFAGAEVALLSGTNLLPTLNIGVRLLARWALYRHGIEILTDFRAAAITKEGVRARDGRFHAADLVLVSTAARAPAWLGKTGLKLTPDGSIVIGATLQADGRDDVFAVGDCATRIDDPREKAGVFAVRQGPILARNLRARATGEALDAHKAQKKFLTLLNTADGKAIAGRGGYFAWAGKRVWRWKDAIDRRFMAMFAEFGRELARPATAAEIADGTAMRCAGCAAKIGPDPLARALSRLPAAPAPRDKILVGLGDDAAVTEVAPGTAQIETIDQIAAMISDPYVFGEIATQHAINDVLAMGGDPTRALALATVPRGGPRGVESDLVNLLAGARNVLDAQRIALIGGHSAEGEGLAFGLSVVGRAAPDSLKPNTALVAGDVLILTKPIGAGLILAADMRGAVAADIAMATIASMRRSNAAAAPILGGHAHALTDVTGFGLAGHLMEMLRPGRLEVRLDLDAVPLLPGALDLAKAGYRSTLTPQNAVLGAMLRRAENGALPDAVEEALLFDPQTSGGLLASVPEAAAKQALAALQAAGYAQARIIGRVAPRDTLDVAIFCEGRLA
jgi:selenide, water dikinase